MKPGREQRQNQREPVQSRVWVRWVDENGVPLGGRVRSQDVSERGIRVQLDHRVTPYTYVHIECHELKLAGLAIVRHCTRQGMAWSAGLQVGSRSTGRD
jgi:hypothetical protein